MLKLFQSVQVVFIAVVGSLAVAAPAEDLYQERLRPRFHFTADRGYLNDPNGLVHVEGIYHLFFQHDGFGKKKWGHATSTDLLHWRQKADAIVPRNGFDAFSGSAVLDANNTSGFGTEEDPPIVAIFTSWGEGQCLAYSTDRGETFQRYADNPILSLPNDAKKDWPITARDPHVMWDWEQGRWVMVLYDSLLTERDKNRHRHKQGGFSIFTSPDLKRWTRRSHVPGFYVCPDVIRLPIDEEPGQAAWVAMDWEKYAIGEFDGESFEPKSEMRPLDFGANLSANQSWKHLPDGRTVQIAWVRGGKYPGMPFNQQMNFPTTLSLRRIVGELRLCKQPIGEIRNLYATGQGSEQDFKGLRLPAGEAKRLELDSESFDLEIDVELRASGKIEIDVLGQSITLTHDSISVLGKTASVERGLRRVRILADVTTIEVYANQGEATMTFAVVPPEGPSAISLLAAQDTTLPHLAVRCVGSIWGKPKSGPNQPAQPLDPL